jgi:hypothetical protein
VNGLGRLLASVLDWCAVHNRKADPSLALGMTNAEELSV